MAAMAESTDSPCAERVRTVTPLASRLRSRTSSTGVLSTVGEMTSATCTEKAAHRLPCTHPVPVKGGALSGCLHGQGLELCLYPTQTALHNLEIK